MADAAVSFLLNNLKQLALREIRLFAGAANELNQLMKELETMKSFLEDNADTKSKGKSFKTWEKQIREVVHKAEDIIDSCLTHAAGKKSNFLSMFNPRGVSLAEQVNYLVEKEIKTVFNTSRLEFAKLPASDDEESRARNAVERIRQIEPLGDKKILGFEDEIETLIQNLKQDKSELEAITIVGMPGIGKTTVASKIFRDSTLDNEFPIRLWVNVSEEYHRRDIYQTMLKKFTSQDLFHLSDADMAERVREYLNQVKFLLVLDDVWTVDAWKDIKAALPMNKGSGKVLITSRYDEVALNANSRRDPYRLRFLTFQESWKLLQIEVYREENVWPYDLQEIGQLIARECHGLPLALGLIGGILLNKISTPDLTKREWTKVSQSVKEYMLTQDKQKSMEKIIALSYDKLPYHLRDCFLYMGMFPEDFEIPVWKLTRLWIAEGFIKDEPELDLSLEEMAEENLQELIKRNLLIVGKKNVQGETKTCIIHDMIREFCKKEAAYEELNFLQEIRMSTKQGIFLPQVAEVPKFRRLCLHSYVQDFFKEKPNGPHVRSFLSFCKDTSNVTKDFSFSLLLEAFDLLRVFEGNHIEFPRFSTKLNQLIHLRYITLTAGTSFKVLPDSISKLWNLQTIVINTSSRTFEVKVDLSDMARLRHFKTRAAIILTKDKRGTPNKNLQTLTRLSTQSCKDEVLSKAPNLKRLGICGELISLINTKSLQKLVRLEKLKMINDSIDDKPMPRLPDFPPSLKVLILSATNLTWDHMNTLAMLRQLEVLKLKEYAFKGEAEHLKVVGGGFYSLHFLQIERSDLTIWTLSDGSFPQLKSLVLKNCEKLLTVPIGLAKSLQHLKLEWVSKSAAVSALEMTMERYKIHAQHPMERGEIVLEIAAVCERCGRLETSCSMDFRNFSDSGANFVCWICRK